MWAKIRDKLEEKVSKVVYSAFNITLIRGIEFSTKRRKNIEKKYLHMFLKIALYFKI